MERKFMRKQENITPVWKWTEKIRTAAQKAGRACSMVRDRRTDCLLCLESTAQTGLCQNCERLLARTGFVCPGCAIPLAARGWCGNCLRGPPAFDRVVAAFDYRFPLDRLVQRFKFSADLAVGATLGDALARAVAHGPRPDLVVASPISAARLRERGFNPALLLARRVASRHGIALDGDCLAKMRHTPPQTGLDAAARLANVRGAFAVTRRVAELHVAIVDDVMTTGATLEEMARALKDRGAARVSGWVAARTPEPGRRS